MATEPQHGRSRRDEILVGAARLFARQGIAATTIRAIGEEAGIAWGSLYHHFASKDEIVEAVLARSLGDLQGWYAEALAATDDPLGRFAAMVRASFRAVAEHTDACAVYLNDRGHLAGNDRFAPLFKVEAELQQQWLDVIEAAIDAGRLRPDLEPVGFFRFAVYPIWLSAGWFHHQAATHDELADRHLSLLLEGAAHPEVTR